ncbi:MAG: PAS domain S-box protein [Thermodesulfobacteriota bacterium]
MTRWWSSLRFRLACLVALGLVPATILVIHGYVEHSELSGSLAQEKAFLTAGQVGVGMANLVETTRHLLTSLAKEPAIRNLDFAACRKLVEQCYGEKPIPFYTNIGMIDSGGTLVCSAIPYSDTVTLSHRYYFRQTLLTRDFSIGHFQVGGISGKSVIVFGYPVIDDSGQARAVLFAALDLSWFNKLVSAVDLPEGSTLTVIDQEGTVLSRNIDPEKWVGKSAPEVEIVQACLSHRQGMIDAKGIDGVRKLYGFRPLGHFPQAGYVYVGVPAETLLAKSRESLLRHLIWLGVSVGLGLFAVWFFGYVFVARKTAAITHAARSLAKGDLTARTRLSHGDGEIGELGVTFDRMAENLSERQAERDQALAGLLREKQLSDAIIDSIAGTFYLFDHTGRMKRWNSNLEHLSGFSHQEVALMSPVDFFPDEEKEVLRKAIETALVKGEVIVEAAWVSRHGTKYPYLFTAKRMNIDGVDHVVGMGIDISARKVAEDALRESEEKYRILVEKASELICVLQDDRFVFANPRALASSGYSLDELLSKPFLEVVYPEDRDIPLRLYQQAMSGQEVGDVSVFRAIDKSGRTRWAQVSVVRIQWEGRPAVLVLGTDITELKEAEQILRSSEAKFRGLFENSIDGIYITTSEGVMIDANQSFLDLFGYTREEMVGKSVLKTYLDRADRERFRLEIQKRGSVKDYPLRLRKKDGTEMHGLLTTSAQRLHDPGVVWYQGILRDVTHQKLLERQLLQAQKMEAIGTLAGGIAHDFNNLLTVINGYSELLLADKNADDTDYEDLRKIHLAGRRGADLVQRLLTLSRRAESKPKILNLNREIENVRKLLERTIPKMITIELDLADDLAAIQADPTQVEQILMNLAINARDAMPQGGRLTVETKNVVLDEEYARTHLEARPGPYVMLCLSDTGKGMDEETQHHIFEPFFTTKETGKGTGLGLAMVYGIVKQHGGHITCYSEPGLGTTFRVYFPVLDLELDERTAENLSLPPGGTETVLLVDDEELIRDFGEKLMKHAGYTVLTAANGREALEVYEKEQANISLVLLDVIMPKMGGKECFEELLKVNPRIKVLIASGYASGGTAKLAEELGAKGFVSKPYEMRKLLQAVREAIDAE